MSVVVAVRDNNRHRMLRIWACAYIVSLFICGLATGCIGGRPQPPSTASKVVSDIKVTQLLFDGKEPDSGSFKKSLKQEMTITGSVEVPARIAAINIIGVFGEWRVKAYNSRGYRIHAFHGLHLQDRNLNDPVAGRTLNFDASIQAPEVKGRFEFCCGVSHSIPGTFDIANSVFYRNVIVVE